MVAGLLVAVRCRFPWLVIGHQAQGQAVAVVRSLCAPEAHSELPRRPAFLLAAVRPSVHLLALLAVHKLRLLVAAPVVPS